ncbi:MAG: nicotinate-nicotinamide nucleotide adenylyltransferase [Brevinematia bacterium]
MNESIALFGGTFNPFHNGHMTIIKSAIDNFKFSKLIVMPAFISPLKDVSGGWDSNMRYLMTGVSIFYFQPDELNRNSNLKKNPAKWEKFIEFYSKNFPLNHNPDVVLSDFEIKKGGVSYTIDSLTYLKSIYPHSEISIIIGLDEASMLEKWKDYKKIFEIAKFLVVRRPGFDEKEVLKKFPQLIFFPFEEVNISSTEIREKIKRGEDISNYIPPVLKMFLDSLIN